MEESDGETADSVWFGYECKSGETLFYYNQKTGEHRWAKDLCCSESNIIKVSISDLSEKHPSDVHSVGTQTEDYGCTNGCSSIYIHNEDHTVTSNRDEIMCPVDRPSNICGVSVDDGHHLEQSETMIPNREDEDNVIDEEWNGGSEKVKNDEDCILTDSCQSRENHCSFEFCKKNTSESTEESTVNGSCESIVSCATPQNVIKCLENSDYKRQETERDSEVSDSYKSTDLSSSAPGDLPSTEGPQKKTKKSRNDSPVEHDKGFGSKNKDCDENGKDKDMNKKQKKSKHGRKVSIQGKNQRRERKVSQNISRETYKKNLFGCAHCDEQFALKRNLYNHCHIHKGVKPLKCSYCGKAFSHKSRLKSHMRRDTKEKPYKCSHCDKALSQKSDLIRHIRTHTGKKPFKCSQCGKAFSLKSALIRHIRIHTGEKPFKCSHCGKAFKCKSNLNHHIRMHTGEKPFKCSHCGKAFSRKSNLNRHIRMHTGEKPFNCSQCGKAFSQKSNLISHIRTHTGEASFKCSHCGKTFSQKSSLKRHMRTHTGEKPFKCSHCGKTFSQKSDLTNHIRTHTGEKPFKC